MDHIEEAIQAAAKIKHLHEEIGRLSADRRAALTQARATMSAAEIAEQLGISTARVYRILSGKET